MSYGFLCPREKTKVQKTIGCNVMNFLLAVRLYNHHCKLEIKKGDICL